VKASHKNPFVPVLACALAGLVPAVAAAADKRCAEVEFEHPRLFVVFNSTDDDAQVILAGASESVGGITALSIDGPRNAVAINAYFDDGRNLGQADFQFDSPEPSLARLKHAYPAGLYRFSATTSSKCMLRSELRLSYKLPSAPVIVFPLEGDSGVPSHGFVAMWQGIADADAIRLAVEVEEVGTTLAVDLPGDATSFNVPGEFLKPGLLYTMDVIAIAKSGNRTVTDVQFTTGH